MNECVRRGGGMMLTEEREKNSEKPCSCVPLCTKNPTWICGGEIHYPP